MARTGFLFVIAASAGLAAQTAIPKELQPLQGHWAVVDATANPIPAGLHVSLLITGDKYEGTQQGKVNEQGTIKVDATRTPSSIDFAIAMGADAGKTQLGLVEVKGDTMTMALAAPGGADRPVSFAEKITLWKIRPLGK